jgi:sirohydrochlorin ferrochelatase
LTAVDHSQIALLLAAHGERRPGAANESVWRIARAVSERGLVSEVGAGFISGAPTIKDALDRLTAGKVIVYPLFASSGYFTRDRLVHLLDAADDGTRKVEMLPPLGLDPGLPDVVVACARQAAHTHDFRPETCTVILLAHGSRRDPASRQATEHMAREVARTSAFPDVRIAFLEERPFLDEAAREVSGPAIVVGLFSGEGMHGAKDAPRLTAGLGRKDVVFAGVIGSAPGIDAVVARSVEAAVQRCRHE